MKRLGLVLLGVLLLQSGGSAQSAARLYTAVKAVCPAITGVVMGRVGDRTTWTVTPAAQQACAQATLDAYDPDAPAALDTELDGQVRLALDNERLISAVVWTVIDTYSPPATMAKYNAARSKIIAVYKSQPWK